MSEDWSKTIFREEADELLAELETTLLELEQASGDATLVNRAFRALHTIKGSGAMFGFDEIAAFTHEVESLFDRVRAGSLAVTRELLSATFHARDHILALLADSLSPAEKQERGETIFRELAAAAAQEGDGAPAPASGAIFQSSAESAAESSGESEAEPAVEPRTYQIRLRPRAGSLPEGYSLEPLLEELAGLGRTEVAHLAEGNGPEIWTIALETDRAEEDVRDLFFFAEVDLDVAIAMDGGEAVFADEALPAAEAVQRHDPGPPEVKREAAPPAPVASMPGSLSSSLRVSAAKLDKLVDLVGELVIIQSQLSQLALERQDTLLTLLSEGLERLADELRDTTLGVRMVPIGSSFTKFQRLVRDLGEELGKDVELVTEGAETELDKTVIERLADPLLHLVRNAMDHGIELPEERRRLGKPGRGRIRIAAEHSGGEVVLRLDDDGRGIDVEAIRAKARELGLPEGGEDASERDLYRLLFEPGFSTAGAVTSVSGRGVGLDVVGQAIESLRGSIFMTSTPGRGAAITIHLPLTLAIIEGLQVRSGDEYYVIPLNLVQECLELTTAQRREREGRRLLDIRGKTVPYASLREWFEIPGERPVIEHVVVTRVEKHDVGIVVDEVVGEHQTVIKTLGRVYRNVEGISGATIRGNGTIALILDVPAVVRRLSQGGG